MDKEQLERAAGEAEMLLQHPLLVGAFQVLEENAIEAAVNSNGPDDPILFSSIVMIRAIRNLKSELEMLVLEHKHAAPRDR